MGRPREFDTGEALVSAMELFWEKGYEGASLGELCEVMGITKPSLYATYGNKEELFLKALDHYDVAIMDFIGHALQLPTVAQVMTSLLHGYVDAQTLPGQPSGCLGVHGAMASSESGGMMFAELVRRRGSVKERLTERLARGRLEGDLPPDAEPADLATFAMVVAQGTATQAKAGGTRAELHRAVDLALRAFPGLDFGSGRMANVA